MWGSSAPKAKPSGGRSQPRPVGAASAAINERAPNPATATDPARAFFQSGAVVRVRITLDAADRQKLREKAREYAPARIEIDGDAFPRIGLKLKGAAGSFREIDDRPGFTVNLGKFAGQARFHGLQRFHLNNGAQDDSRLCEWLGGEIFTAAGLPAPRVAHAHVWLDDKDLGLYVLREGYDVQFLQRAFGTTAGNLYDGGFCQDVDAELQKDGGDGPADHSDLQRLCTACRGVDATREKALGAVVDANAFIDFLALELMLGHWDGYSSNMNNYRLWLPATGGARFLPHGMDQLFGDADASVLDHPPAIVASAMMQQPAFRKRYRERLKALLPLFAPDRLAPHLQQLGDRLQKELHTTDAEAARNFGDAVRGLLARVQDRYRSLERQVKAPEPKPLQLAIGKPLRLDKWNPAPETDRVELPRKPAFNTSCYGVVCLDRGDEPRRGVWRTHVLLGKGRYQLRGTARCEKIEPPPKDGDGNAHGGVALRAGDTTSTRLSGDRGWTPLVCEFEIGEFQRNLELACDVQAFVGKAWFRCDSLQLVRIAD